MDDRKASPAAARDVVTTVRIPTDLHAQIAQAASVDRRSINAEILHLLEQMLAIRQRRMERDRSED